MSHSWQALNPLAIHVTFTAIVPGAYPGEAKMCRRLSWRSQAKPNASTRKTAEGDDIPAWLFLGSQTMLVIGWLQKLTHVPLAIAILLVSHTRTSSWTVLLQLTYIFCKVEVRSYGALGHQNVHKSHCMVTAVQTFYLLFLFMKLVFYFCVRQNASTDVSFIFSGVIHAQPRCGWLTRFSPHCHIWMLITQLSQLQPRFNN